MAQCGPGDQIVCKIKNNTIVSALSGDWDESRVFEIISNYEEGYIIYIPHLFVLKDSVQLTADNYKKFNADKKFIDSSVYYITDYGIAKIYKKADGMRCIKCSEFYEYAEANQSDGTLVCWNCRKYPFYK